MILLFMILPTLFLCASVNSVVKLFIDNGVAKA